MWPTVILLLCLSVCRVYTLIHVVSYRGTEKDYKEREPVGNNTHPNAPNEFKYCQKVTLVKYGKEWNSYII